jgi:hypothetical protein
MSRSDLASSNGDACLAAANKVHAFLKALADEIDRSGDPSIGPGTPLPVDVFLSEMVKRRNAPRIIFEPKRLKDQVWTESVTAYVYGSIEAAFVAAGKLPGGNRSGHVQKLRDLRVWIEQQERNPSRPAPKFFTQKTTMLFSKGILEERRKDRIEVIGNIEHCTPTRRGDLAKLKKWVEQDLADSRLRRKGRPTGYQKIVFAAEIANLWNTLTGNPISKGPETNFAKFVVACWQSGFGDTNVNSDFKRTIRDHIAASNEPCGQCENCKKSEKCERKRYYGILM